MKKRQAATTAVMAVIAGAALAAGTETEVLVTGSRDYREALRVPANITILTAADIQRAGHDTIVDALEGVGGLYFRSTSGNASQAEVGMRGFGENSHGRVLILLDGRKLNRPDMAGVNWLQIPLSNVERVEIVRGAHSVLYGDHAVGGVINIITKKGTKEPQATASVMAGSFETDTERAVVTGSEGKLSYAVNAEHQETDGYRDRSAYSAWGAGGNLSYDFNESLNAMLGVSYNKLEYELPGYLTPAQMAENPRQSVFPDDSADNDYLSADLTLNYEITDKSRTSVDFVFGRKDIKSDVTSWFSFVDLAVDSFAVTPRYMLDGELFGRKHKLVAGVDYSLDMLTVSRFTDNSRSSETSDADVDKSTLGFYARDEYSLSDKLILGAGARVETAEIDARVDSAGAELFDDGKTHDENAVEVSMTYLFDPASKLFAKFATVYRYPFVDEQVVYFGFGADQLYEDIDAENGYDVEVGAVHRLTETVTFDVTAFLLTMEDEIAYNAVTFRNENLDDTRHAGAEAGVSWSASDELTVDANYTYTEATFIDGPNDGNDIPLVPAHQGTIAAELALPFGLSLRTAARYVDATRLGGDFGNTAEKLPDYTTVDLLLRYESETADGLEAYVAVDNVFDENYASLGYQGWDTAGYYPSPERAIRGGVSYRF